MKEEDETTRGRREFLRSTAGALGLGWVGLNWPAIAAASHHAYALAAASSSQFSFLSQDEARDIVAIAAQIVPSGATPGATEAGVVHFIDQVHVGLFKARAAEFRAGLEEFSNAFKAAHPGAGQFADLAPEAQVEYLRSIEATPFFALMRSCTLMGLLSSPIYGGNRDSAGWKLVGFDDGHVWAPPFGYYDRDYPGFVPYSINKKTTEPAT